MACSCHQPGRGGGDLIACVNCSCVREGRRCTAICHRYNGHWYGHCKHELRRGGLRPPPPSTAVSTQVPVPPQQQPMPVPPPQQQPPLPSPPPPLQAAIPAGRPLWLRLSPSVVEYLQQTAAVTEQRLQRVAARRGWSMPWRPSQTDDLLACWILARMVTPRHQTWEACERRAAAILVALEAVTRTHAARPVLAVPYAKAPLLERARLVMDVLRAQHPALVLPAMATPTNRGVAPSVVAPPDTKTVSPKRNAAEPEVAAAAPKRGKPNPECCVCLDAMPTTAFAPCGHVACCDTCSKSLATCPICQTAVVSRLRVYQVA